ncbi:MAG TPA: hypothetical protein DDZ89_19830 [Clostridiales bacterium]|nr:hypothetical protein [Clostridiales bacterium]
MNEVLIRQVVDSDIEVIEDIAVAAFAVHYEFYQQKMGDAIFQAIHKDWKEKKKKAVRDACLQENGWHAFVAEIDGKIVGFVTLKCDLQTKCGTMGNNSVDPKYQGQGIGKRLYKAALDFMRVNGMEYSLVQTGLGPTFDSARSAYEKSGYDRQLQTCTYYMEL